MGLGIFYYTPYSFYLEPSYWQFRNMCKINELPNNEEKYNKILGYYNLNLDTLDYSKFQETTTLNFYQQKPPYKKMKVADKNLYFYYPLGILYKADISSRISLGVGIDFNNDKPNSKQDVESVSMSPEWQTFRIEGIEWNIATSGDFRMPTKILDCDYFKRDKKTNNKAMINKLKDYTELAMASYGYFHLANPNYDFNKDNADKKRLDYFRKITKNETIFPTPSDILSIEYKYFKDENDKSQDSWYHKRFLGGDFTPTQAKRFFERYELLIHQPNTESGFSATLFGEKRKQKNTESYL